MPFIPHTEADISEMLEAIGADSIEALFDEVPDDLLRKQLPDVAPALSEMEIARLARERASRDAGTLNFIGAGAYEHHIPSAVWQLATRGEFYSAYTPYQAEASQGTLQLIYEYQSMMTELLAMDVSNASLYDGASALAEAVLMAVRAKRGKVRRVLIPRSVHPRYVEVVQTLTSPQGIEIDVVPFDSKTGATDPDTLRERLNSSVAAVVIPQPNFFGVLEAVHELADVATAHGAVVIALVNPLSASVLEPPGRWGDEGADIACGEGQPLGVPLAFGGPYFGFFSCKQELIRQLPGRLVARTEDAQGREGFTLTLQAREQHIRRDKAKSNICTNQGLVVAAATIYLSLLGAEGLRRVALQSMDRLEALRERLVKIPGVEPRFEGSHFHECAFRVAQGPDALIERAVAERIAPGLGLGRYYQDLDDSLLICTTETKTDADLDRLAELMRAGAGLEAA